MKHIVYFTIKGLPRGPYMRLVIQPGAATTDIIEFSVGADGRGPWEPVKSDAHATFLPRVLTQLVREKPSRWSPQYADGEPVFLSYTTEIDLS
jgi:hypothetical protein